MAAYAERHYGFDSHELDNPKVIVQHITVTDDFESVYNTFAANTPDVELKELPGVCSHYVVDTDGTIYRLVPESIMCRHTVGLNYTSIGIENVARTDADLLGNRRQLRASRRLTRWLQCRHDIGLDDVIGHNESLSSRYHDENVARLRTQTHGDMTATSMREYESGLRDDACGCTRCAGWACAWCASASTTSSRATTTRRSRTRPTSRPRCGSGAAS